MMIHTKFYLVLHLMNLCICNIFPGFKLLLLNQLIQSAALHPLAVHAPTLEQTTVNMTMSATTAAAWSNAAQMIQLGQHLLVSRIQAVGLDSGSRHHSVLQEAVAARVRSLPQLNSKTLFHRYCQLAELPWKLSQQHNEDRDNKSGARNATDVTIHCIQHPVPFHLRLRLSECHGWRRDNLAWENLRLHPA